MEKKVSSIVELVASVSQLEVDLIVIFSITRDQLLGRTEPLNPNYGAEKEATQWARPNPDPVDELPGRGFQGPAPPDAPRLPPPKLDPVAAYRKLQGDLHRVRTVAAHLRNSAKLVDAIADLIEKVMPGA